MQNVTTSNVVFLEGERLYLRPLGAEDAERCTRWINDPEVRQFLMARFPVSGETEREWLAARGKAVSPPTDIVFAIVLKEGDRHIGNMGLELIDWVNRHGTTGALIGEKDCWNKGYGSEAKELLLRYAFDTLDLYRVNSGALSSNPRSIAYLKKSGYVEEGRRRETEFRNGVRVDHVLFGLLATEWRSRRAASAGPA